MKRDAVETRKKILKIAELEFAENGFDGARVDDIAKKAGVNQALIYYYFKSKDDILNELFETLMTEGAQVQSDSLISYTDLNQEDVFRSFFDKSLEFALMNKNLIRIALIESLKTGSKHAGLLERCAEIIKTEVLHIEKVYQSKGLDFPYQIKDFVAMEFFMGILPIFNFAVYYDKLMVLYGMDEAELKDQFVKAFRLSHMMSHQNKYWEK